MKTKRFDKKLVLNKKTIVHLNIGEMNEVQGQGDTEFPCPTVIGPTCVVPTEGKCGQSRASICCIQC